MTAFWNARLATIGVLLLTSCNAPAPSPTREVQPSTTQPTASTRATPSPPASSPRASATPTEQPAVISDQGIGTARLGMTIAQLKQELGATAEFVVQSPFMVDFDAIAVRQSGQVQYYILYLAGQQPRDDQPIQGLLTTNPRYQTAAGVGAGTMIAQAEAAYGKATLSHNTQNESREYARFEQQPAAISFATGNGNQQFAGIYPNTSSEYRETPEYRSDAVIQSVLVVCLAQGCAEP